MGVLRFPHTSFEKADKILNEITEDVAYTDALQDTVAPAGYFKSIRRHDAYMKNCHFLPYLNNEKNFQQQSVDRMTQLKFLVAIMYLQDEVVFPKESEHFGYYADATETTTIKMEDTEEYKKDLFGLKTLNESGRLTFLECDAGHVHPTYQWCLDNIIPWLNPDKLKDTPKEETMLE